MDNNGQEGLARKVVRASNGEGVVFSYRFIVAALGFICAGLSGFIATAVVQQGQELAVLVDSREKTLHRFEAMEVTVGQHSAEIDSQAVQERQDSAYLQEQITQLAARIQDQDQKIQNMGMALARVRGARGPND